MRPAGWPKYMLDKPLKSGVVAYYWNPPSADIKAGFTLHREPLGTELPAAIARANELNQHLFSWRDGRGADRDLDLQPGFGTLDWLFERYYRSRAFEKISARVQPDYRRELGLISKTKLKDGRLAGMMPVKSFTALGVDKIYSELLNGPRGRRVRQANICVSRAERAWDVIARLYPRVVPPINPFAGVERDSSDGERPACTREQAMKLADALEAIGHPHLAVAPLICFEWLQRPENLLDGHLTWAHWRPADKPTKVQIFHHKTGERIWYPLEDEHGLLCPEIEARLAKLKRLGMAIVVTPGVKGKPRPYSHYYARAMVRRARELAELPDYVTLDACRHGGLTEIGDSELTETDEMSLSGHKTPQAKRRYVKKTETQQVRAARKRRAWVEEKREQTAADFQNGPKAALSE